MGEYKLRSSSDYVDMWKKFLHDSIFVKASPIFQYVLMKKIIKEHFSVEPSIPSTSNPASLDYLDKNAIRYTAGYVIRSLQKKVKKSAHPLKVAIELCLKDIEEDGGKHLSCILSHVFTKVYIVEYESDEWTDLRRAETC